MYLAKSFTVPVELVQKSDVVVTGRPSFTPVQKTTGATSQMKATQPVETPGASTAGALIGIQPVEVPGATTVMWPTSQHFSDQFATDRR